jgi:hypothetical protein
MVLAVAYSGFVASLRQQQVLMNEVQYTTVLLVTRLFLKSEKLVGRETTIYLFIDLKLFVRDFPCCFYGVSL